MTHSCPHQPSPESLIHPHSWSLIPRSAQFKALPIENKQETLKHGGASPGWCWYLHILHSSKQNSNVWSFESTLMWFQSKSVHNLRWKPVNGEIYLRCLRRSRLVSTCIRGPWLLTGWHDSELCHILSLLIIALHLALIKRHNPINKQK